MGRVAKHIGNQSSLPLTTLENSVLVATERSKNIMTHRKAKSKATQDCALDAHDLSLSPLVL